MADHIKSIIQTFEDDEKREFRLFINRQRAKKNRKDLALFDIFCESKEYKSKEVVTKLYGATKANAYHSIRKRLLKHLMNFIIVKRMDEDTTSASGIMGLISVAQHLFSHGKNNTGWNYLNKAEFLALGNDQFDLLDNIYNIQLQHAIDTAAPPLEDILKKWKKTRKLAEEDENIDVAATIINVTLAKVKVGEEQLDIQQFIVHILKEYHLTSAIIERPRILYRFISMIRGSVLASKEYFEFESLLIEQYHKVENDLGFARKDHFYKLHLLYMICHVLYRNRKFEEAILHLQKFKENIHLHNKSYFNIFYPKYILLYAAVQSFQGNSAESINIVTNALDDDSQKMGLKHRLNMKMNLAVYYFQLNDFRKANQIIISISKTDSWASKNMGVEWVARKNLVEIITQFEIGNIDIVLNRIRSYKKQHAQLVELPIYQRIKTFIGFIEDCINKPEEIHTPSYEKHVFETLERHPVEREDILAMAFYCWLKAKMLQRPYYEVLLETANQPMDHLNG